MPFKDSCLIMFFMNNFPKRLKNYNDTLFLMLVLALGIRLVLAIQCKHYPETIENWAQLIWQVGPGDFYASGVQWPYPPLYLYILWLMQAIIELFHVQDPGLRSMIIQLPPILADLGCGILVYRSALVLPPSRSKRFARLSDREAFRRIPVYSLLLSASYLFNPAVIHNSAVWGQTDGFFTFFIALMCVSLYEGKMSLAYISYGIALMVKQQSLTFAPVLLVGILVNVILNNFSKERFLKNLLAGLAVIAGMVLISLPFGFREMLEQYLSVKTSGMPYVSVNAYNFWALVHRNFAPLASTFAGIPCGTWGNVAIMAVTLIDLLYALFCYRIHKKALLVAKNWEKQPGGASPRNALIPDVLFPEKEAAGPNAPAYNTVNLNYPLLGAMLILPVFTFATGMHERYLLSGLILLLLGSIYARQDSFMVWAARPLGYLYIIFSMIQFANTYIVFENALGNPMLPEQLKLTIVSALEVLATLLLYLLGIIAIIKNTVKKKD